MSVVTSTMSASVLVIVLVALLWMEERPLRVEAVRPQEARRLMYVKFNNSIL